MSLSMLALDIQDSILMLTRVREKRDTVREHNLRGITRTFDWGVQREIWSVPPLRFRYT